MKQLFMFISFLFVTAAVTAQNVVATSSEINRSQIAIGEQVELRLKGSFVNQQQTQWFTIDSIPNFEIINKSAVDTTEENNVIQLTQVIFITGWDTGTFVIPSFILAPGMQTAPLTIAVSFSDFNEAADYHDIKDILDVPKPERVTWYWYLAIAALLIMIFSLIFPTSKSKETPAKTKVVIDKDVFAFTIKELQQLQKKAVTMEAKEYYSQLIILFRNYLTKRKNISSHSKTTDDLAIQLNQLQLNENLYRQVMQEMRLSDFVKFAKYEASTTEKEHSADVFIQTIKAIEDKS